MAAPEGTITVKLKLDATEFHAELDKVIERLENLSRVTPQDLRAAVNKLKAEVIAERINRIL
jgi:GTP-dependent phosphoenolpyruvate carboxykinase